MPAVWRIDYWPRCVAYVFLSHCAEDRETLVKPVYRELRRRGIAPWLDHYHYPVGRESIETLHEELLKARHVAYFITPAMLRQGRGWTSSERAFTATIQQQLRYNHEIAHVELPLLFIPADDPIFQRSIWCSLRERGRHVLIHWQVRRRLGVRSISSGLRRRSRSLSVKRRRGLLNWPSALIRTEACGALQRYQPTQRLLAESPPPLGHFLEL